MPLDENGNGHTAFIYDRGGRRRRWKLNQLSQVKWDRRRDDISAASLAIPLNALDGQGDTLDQINAGRHELVLFRGTKRVWEGPVGLPKFTKTGMTLGANDCLYYAARTIMRSGYDNSYGSQLTPGSSAVGDTLGLGSGYVTARAATVLRTELGRDWETLNPPLNVVPFIVEHHALSTEAQTTAKSFPFQYYAWQHVDDLAARSGIDYTVIGRAIHIWDTSNPAMGTLPKTATEADFIGLPDITEYGSELATRSAATDGQGTYGTAGMLDDYYGAWDFLATAYDENATTAPTTAELASQAERNLYGRYPTPMRLAIPDSTQLVLGGAFDIDHLVPGMYVPLRAKFGVKTVTQKLKLNTVVFTQTDKGETIQVSMVPATAPDDSEE